uniref:Uncharacterized protein n=1 Tax=Peromyscus maniculatus bairdii TaxID=230844 RepID=A0A8C8UCL9_PERMB
MVANATVNPSQFLAQEMSEFESTPEGRRIAKLDQILLNVNNITMLVPREEGPEV